MNKRDWTEVFGAMALAVFMILALAIFLAYVVAP